MVYSSYSLFENNALQIFLDLEMRGNYVFYQCYQGTYISVWESALRVLNLKIL